MNIVTLLSKSRICNSTSKNYLEFCDLYAHALPIFLLCKFKIIILKTVEFAETRILLCHVLKAKVISKSRICNSSTAKFDKSFVTFMHMPSLYSSCAASFKVLS